MTPIRSIPAEGLRHEVGDVVITAFRTPQAGCLVQVRRDGRLAREACSQHDDETGAVSAYRALVERFETSAAPAVARPAVLAAEGDQISHRAGNAVITLQRTRFTWIVTTIVGTQRADEWSRAYATEAEARAAARHVAEVFTAYGTDTRIAAEREQLVRRLAATETLAELATHAA